MGKGDGGTKSGTSSDSKRSTSSNDSIPATRPDEEPLVLLETSEGNETVDVSGEGDNPVAGDSYHLENHELGEDSSWQEEWGDAEQANFMLSLPQLEPYPNEESHVEDTTAQLDEDFGEETEMEDESPSLEAIFEDIEEIVHHLETEEVSLEESLRLFEQGIRFCREASKRLDEAEGVIERLLRDPESGDDDIVPWQD